MADLTLEEERSVFMVRWRLAGHAPKGPHSRPTLAAQAWIMICARCNGAAWWRGDPIERCTN